MKTNELSNYKLNPKTVGTTSEKILYMPTIESENLQYPMVDFNGKIGRTDRATLDVTLGEISPWTPSCHERAFNLPSD